MTKQNDPAGILIVGHGSPRAEANDGFVTLAGRIGGRLCGTTVLPAFFSIAQPDIPTQLGELRRRGIRRVVLMPYFLFRGQHISKDIPTLLDDCRRQYPDMTIELLPTLENEPALEDIVVDRLTPFAVNGHVLPTEGAAIEGRSFELIDGHLRGMAWRNEREAAVVRRAVHATADVTFARSMRIHPVAVERGVAALTAGKPVICDIEMLKAGITRSAGPVLCAVSDEDVIAAARTEGCTRAAAAMEKLAPRMDGAVVAVGNAPTALWKIMELARNGGPQPAVVVGLPVGLVGARESKLALIESGLCYVTNTTPRGGSPVAAAAVNALALLAKKA